MASGMPDRPDRSKAPSGSRAKKSSQKGRSRRGGRGRPGSRSKTDAVRESAERSPLHPASIESLPSRKFDCGESEWIVRLSGRVSIGSRGDAGTQLLHLTFFRAVDPLVAARESLAPATSLEEIPEELLRELLESARSAD